MVKLSAYLSIALAALACTDTTLAPDARNAPTFQKGGAGRPVVLVNPNAGGNGTAATIQEGIDMVAGGGRVMVKPGTYPEALVINKGLTLEGIDEETGPVIIATPGAPTTAVQIATPDPVTIRDLELHFSGTHGIRGEGVVDITVERITVLAVNPPLGTGNLIVAANEAPTTGRARLVVRNSFLDGAIPFANSPTPAFPQTFAIRSIGDVDLLAEGNVVRRMGGACIFVQMRNDFGGRAAADIVGNDVDECYPSGRAAAILVAPPGATPLTQPITATGIVNIVGNTIRNTTASCLPTTAIHYEFYTGLIAHNTIVGVVQPCAITPASGARVPSAILVGSFRVASGVTAPAATPVVRFNDIVGNSQAGLRLAKSAVVAIDASCNWWGSASGPSGVGPGTGDAIVVTAGAATPVFTPFATVPIAETEATGC